MANLKDQFIGEYQVVSYCVGLDGQLVNEKVFSGNVICTEDRIVAFARLAEGPFGFTGKYSVENNHFKVQVESCIAPDLEGETFDWNFEWKGGDCKLLGTEISTGRPFQMQVRKAA